MAKRSWIAGALTAALLAASAGAASATPVGSLAGLTSNGALGDIASDLPGGFGNVAFMLNTDNGVIGAQIGQGGTFVGLTTLAFQTVTQSNGPSLSVFDFSSFTLNAGTTLIVVGSHPGVFVTSGAATINGNLVVQSNRNGGGGGGRGANGFALLTNDVLAGGGGGGGGNGSRGQNGSTGIVLGPIPSNGATAPGGIGGAKSPTASLQGGGSGGTGGDVLCCNGLEPGATGGFGGGAVAFITATNLTVGKTGSIVNNGAGGAGGDFNGGGGGGAGGTLCFDVTDIFDNAGLIQAAGGAGGIYTPGRPSLRGGGGSGGIVDIDPLAIINTGVIDVSDGNGSNEFGGQVNTFGTPITGDGGQILGAFELAATVPEPSSFALFALGLAALGLFRRRGGAARPAF